MQEQQLFEYAIIRIVPRVEREEFFNAGVIVYCAAQNFLETKFEINKKLLCCFCDDIDTSDLENRLLMFEKICKADVTAGPIAALNMAARFRWLTAVRSTVIQTSSVHPGFSKNLIETVEKLFKELVQ